MKKFFSGIVLSIFLFSFVSCSDVPITGRNQLNLIPQSQMLSMSFDQYDAFMNQNKMSNDQEKVQMVKSVGQDIAQAVEKYFRQHDMSDELDGYKWEFHLAENDQANAWCMPGGKVMIYTGILPITQDRAGLAAVMGHEIAHAVAEHGNERMSQQLLTQLGGVALSEALSSKPQQTQQLFMAAYGIGAQVGVLLPYSRTHESEADRMGIIFMAMAGYDPHAAVELWKRMKAQSEGQPPEFLSTHPSHESRINNLQKHMDEAMEYYNPNK